jgi:hypothetical protein
VESAFTLSGIGTNLPRSALFLLLTANQLPAQQVDVTPINGLPAKIAQLIDPSAAPGQVQVVTLPGVLGWADDGGRYVFYQVCDNLSEWGPQVRNTGLSVSERYRQFLMGIQVPVGDPLADAEQKKLANEASQARKTYQKMRNEALKGWDELQVTERNVPQAQKTAYSTYMEGYADLAGLEISYESILGRWQPKVAAANPNSVGYNLEHFMSPASSQATVTTYSGAKLSMYTCEPGIDLTKELEKAKAHQGNPDFNIKVTHDTGERHESWEKWGGSGGWGPFSVDVHGTRHNLHTHDTNFLMQITSDVIIRMPVTRPWLNLTLINTYKDAKPYENSELAKVEPLWGQQGSFPLVSKEFVLAYHPHVTLTTGADDYDVTETSLSGGGSFSVGPFHVGADGSGGSKVEKSDKAHSTIEIGTSVDSFVLLGVVNRVMP